MSTSRAPQLRVESDLQLVVGDLRATVVADGQQLVIATKDAGRLLAQAADSAPSVLGSTVTLRQLAGRFGRILDEQGLSALVTSDRGTLVEFGRGCHSSAARLVLGSEHARFGGVGALLPAALGFARASSAVRRRLSYAAGGITIAVLFASARGRRTAVAG